MLGFVVESVLLLISISSVTQEKPTDVQTRTCRVVILVNLVDFEQPLAQGTMTYADREPAERDGARRQLNMVRALQQFQQRENIKVDYLTVNRTKDSSGYGDVFVVYRVTYKTIVPGLPPIYPVSEIVGFNDEREPDGFRVVARHGHDQKNKPNYVRSMKVDNVLEAVRQWRELRDKEDQSTKEGLAALREEAGLPVGDKGFEAYIETIGPDTLSPEFYERAADAWAASLVMYERRFDGPLFYEAAKSSALKEVNRSKLAAVTGPEEAIVFLLGEYIGVVESLRKSSGKEPWVHEEAKVRAVLDKVLSRKRP